MDLLMQSFLLKKTGHQFNIDSSILIVFLFFIWLSICCISKIQNELFTNNCVYVEENLFLHQFSWKEALTLLLMKSLMNSEMYIPSCDFRN